MPINIAWWSFEEIVVKERLVKIIQSLYKVARSCVIVNGTFIDDFLAQVRFHQGTVLSLWLVIIFIKLPYCHSYQLKITMMKLLERLQNKLSFYVLLADKVYAAIPSNSSFGGVGCMSYVVVSDVN